MKLVLLSFCFLLFNWTTLRGQKHLSDAEKDSLNLVRLCKKYSTIISYKKGSFVNYHSRTFLVKKGTRWALIYWARIAHKKKIDRYVDQQLYGHLMFSHKKKKKFISTAKGDSILAFFIDKQFSKLDADSLNTYIGPNQSSYLLLGHCPTTSIYFYHRKKAVEKQAYCLFLYYKTAPNQHKIRFSECTERLLTIIKEK
ncbi:MAG: hypothetical protein ACI976_003000 [Aureispira sp.]|jgi:hypothetical protein